MIIFEVQILQKFLSDFFHSKFTMKRIMYVTKLSVWQNWKKFPQGFKKNATFLEGIRLAAQNFWMKIKISK